jgi:DNA polymerase-3 subunit alpha
MEQSNITVTEMLKWEKELTGVYLSEHPFRPYAGRAEVDGTVLCGQVDREMDGQTIKIAGMVASLHPIVAKDGQTSVAVTLEDLGGSIEVMVWSRIYGTTKDLWQEGNIVLVEGKVRERADQMQLTCDKAARYEPDLTVDVPIAETAATTSLPEKPVPDKRAERAERVSRSAPKEAVKSVVPKETVTKEIIQEMPVTDNNTKPAERKRLIVTLQQTEDAEADIAQLHQLLAVLADYPGLDELSLVVNNGSKIFKLRMGQVRLEYCDELKRRLIELLGSDAFRA